MKSNTPRDIYRMTIWKNFRRLDYEMNDFGGDRVGL